MVNFEKTSNFKHGHKGHTVPRLLKFIQKCTSVLNTIVVAYYIPKIALLCVFFPKVPQTLIIKSLPERNVTCNCSVIALMMFHPLPGRVRWWKAEIWKYLNNLIRGERGMLCGSVWHLGLCLLHTFKNKNLVMNKTRPWQGLGSWGSIKTQIKLGLGLTPIHIFPFNC